MKKRLLGIIVLIIIAQLNSFSQNRESKFNLNVDFSNRHTWRGGLTLGTACIKPSIEYNVNNFKIGAWGLYALDTSYDEVDIYIGYNIGNFSFMAYDFYMPSAGYKNSNFSDYSQKTGLHMFDFTASYTFSGEYPLTIMGAATYYKPEAYMSEESIAKQGELSKLSTYLELSYPTKIAGKNISWTLGMAPGKSRYSRLFLDNGDKLYSQNAFYIVNMGLNISDKIKITDKFSLPISAELTYNPHQDKLYLQVNISLNNN